MKYFFPNLGLRLLAVLIRLLPFSVIGVISTGGATILHRIVRYRRKTALANLTACFPNRTQLELQRLLPSIYLNLTDVFLETIKAFSISPEGIMRYITKPTTEQLHCYNEHFRGAILVTAHFCNWEWCAYCLAEILPNPGIVVYRPLKNPTVDTMMRLHREKYRMKIVPMRETVKMLSRGSGSDFVLLVADQSPDPDGAHWEEFFGIKTAFFKGPATLAYRYDMPVFFVHLERIRRHHYQMHLVPLCLNPNDYKVQDITRMYVQSLEHLIKETPSSWLWTHRRWKHKPPSEI